MKKLFLFGAALLMSLMIGSSSVKSQTCLCDNVAPTNIPWTSDCKYLMVTMPNSAVCSTWVCYCYRVVSNKLQVCISGAGCDPGCYDLTQNWGEANLYFQRVGEAIIKDRARVPNPCPPCTAPLTVGAEVFNSACVKIVNDTVHEVSYLVPCDESGLCKRIYTVCCDENGVPIYTYSSNEAIGNSCTDIINPSSECHPSCITY